MNKQAQNETMAEHPNEVVRMVMSSNSDLLSVIATAQGQVGVNFAALSFISHPNDVGSMVCNAKFLMHSEGLAIAGLQLILDMFERAIKQIDAPQSDLVTMVTELKKTFDNTCKLLNIAPVNRSN